jgi:hypothetical protein
VPRPTLFAGQERPPTKLELPFNELSELRHRCLDELFQFSSDSIASPQANAEVSTSFNQTYFDEQLPDTQDCIESAQDAWLDYAARSRPSWEVQNRDHLPTDRGGYNHSSARQGTPPCLPDIDQRFNVDEDVNFEYADQVVLKRSGEGALIDPQEGDLLARGHQALANCSPLTGRRCSTTHLEMHRATLY